MAKKWKQAAVGLLLTMLLWMRLRNRRPTVATKLAVGVIFGLCAVLSTHFGVHHEMMVLLIHGMEDKNKLNKQ